MRYFSFLPLFLINRTCQTSQTSRTSRTGRTSPIFPIGLAFRPAPSPTFFREIGFRAFEFGRRLLEKLPPIARFVIIVKLALRLTPALSARCGSRVGKALPLSAALSRGRTAVSALVGIVASHVATFIASTRQTLHNARGIAFGNLDVREFAQQINVTHGHAALNIAVDKLHYLARIEPIVLT